MMLDKYKDEIINLYCKGGYSLIGIAEMCGVTHKTVCSSLKSWGIDIDNYNVKTKVYIPKELLSDMYISGQTQEQIAAFFNCSRASIRLRLQRLGLIRNDPNGAEFRRKVLPRDEIIKLYKDGFSCAEISAMFGVSSSVVYSRLVSWGIGRRNFTDANLMRYCRGVVVNRNSTYGKGRYYNTPNQGKRWMRSMWEVAVANYLSSRNIDWCYEYRYLFLDDGSKYLPDFYIPIENRYIEVKGWKTTSTMRKFIVASKSYNIELWDKSKLLELGLVDRRGVVTKERMKKCAN